MPSDTGPHHNATSAPTLSLMKITCCVTFLRPTPHSLTSVRPVEAKSGLASKLDRPSLVLRPSKMLWVMDTISHDYDDFPVQHHYLSRPFALMKQIRLAIKSYRPSLVLRPPNILWTPSNAIMTAVDLYSVVMSLTSCHQL